MTKGECVGLRIIVQMNLYDSEAPERDLVTFRPNM